MPQLSLADKVETNAGTISGSVDQELVLRNEYLVTKIRIGERAGDVQTRERLGDLLNFYYREAA